MPTEIIIAILVVIGVGILRLVRKTIHKVISLGVLAGIIIYIVSNYIIV